MTLSRSARRLKLSKPLLCVHSPFCRSVGLLQNVVQVLDGSVSLQDLFVGFKGRADLLQFGTVALNPAPARRMLRLQTAVGNSSTSRSESEATGFSAAICDSAPKPAEKAVLNL
jgi:hypothetical protein